MTTFRILSTHDDGLVRSRELEIRGPERVVPAMLWTPTGAARVRALVLLGHGGSQFKQHPGVIELARKFILNHGFAALCIDGPMHGSRRIDRRTDSDVKEEFRQAWPTRPFLDEMLQDWQSTVRALESFDELDEAVMAWYGVSMGTAYGLPLCASEPRIDVAVLGMWGASQVDGTAMSHSDLLDRYAAQLRCPVLFQQKWDDQFFSREGQLRLFAGIGTDSKWLKIYPGLHVPVAGEQMDDAEQFIAGRLLQALALVKPIVEI